MNSWNALRTALQPLVTNDPWTLAGEHCDYRGFIIGGESPSQYSESPSLWNDFFRQVGVKGCFVALDLTHERHLRKVIQALIDTPGCVDITITNPYKSAAYAILEQLKPACEITRRVQVLRCLNHLIPDAGADVVHVDNTDGSGMVHAITKRCGLRGKKVLLVGAGSAAAAIGHELIAEDAIITITSIDATEAHNLLIRLTPHAREPGQLHVVKWDTIARTAKRCQVIVSAISHSTPLRAGEIVLLPDDCLCADVRYGDKAIFAREVRAARRPCVDGREMLFGQFWTAAQRVASIHRIDLSAYAYRNPTDHPFLPAVIRPPQ